MQKMMFIAIVTTTWVVPLGARAQPTVEYSYEQACRDWTELPNRVTVLGAKHSPFHAGVYADGAVALAGTYWTPCDEWLAQHRAERVLLSFALGERPDFSHVSREQWLEEGHLPVVVTDWTTPPGQLTDGIKARMITLSHLLNADEAKSGTEPLILRQKLIAENTSAAAADATLWVRLSAMDHRPGVDSQATRLMFSSHTKQPTPYEGGPLRLDGHRLLTDTGRLRAMIDGPPGLRLEFVQKLEPSPESELLENLVGIHLNVPGGTTAEVRITVPVHSLDAQFSDALVTQGFDAAWARTLAFWRRELDRACTIRVPEPALTDMLRTVPWQMMVKMDREPATGKIIPKVNALLYEAVWGHITAWECNALDYLGYHGEVEDYLARFPEWQGQPGTACAIDGVTDFSGYLGAKVPDYTPWNWGAHHGYLMWGLAEHYLLTDDRAWFDRQVPTLLKAADWTIRQLDNTKTSPDSVAARRGRGQGLFPPSVSTDLQDVMFSAFNDAWIYRGLATIAETLQRGGHPRAADIAARAQVYREDIRSAWQRAARENPPQKLADGTEIPFVSGLLEMRDWRDYKERTSGFLVFALMDTGSLHLGECGVFGRGDPELEWALRLMNEGPPEVRFLQHGVSTCEICFAPQFDYFLAIDDPVRAIEVLYSSLAGGMSRRTFSAWEFRGGIQFMPVGVCEVARQLRLMLIRETAENELWLAQATPRHWLADGRRIEVRGAPTRFGPVSYSIDSEVSKGIIRMQITPPDRNPVGRIRLRLRHPEAKAIRSVTIDGPQQVGFAGEWIDLPSGTGTIRATAVFD